MGAVIARPAIVGVLCWTLAAGVANLAALDGRGIPSRYNATLAHGPLAQSSNQEDWAGTAAAVFLTSDERRTWQRLSSDDDREQFKAEYWRRRDSSPQTPVNEFQALIQNRIDAADRQFAIAPTAGSRTARGRVFVLLGPAAVERIVSGPLESAPRMEGALVVLPRAALDAREWHVWVYDRESHSDLMKMLGRRDLELSFIVAPGRADELQSGALLSRVREEVASSSIVLRP